MSTNFTLGDVIKMLIEHDSLSTFFIFAKHSVGDLVFEHSYNKTLQYSHVLDSLLPLNEATNINKPTVKEPYKDKVPNRGGGVGALKELVGKGEDDVFDESDARKVGNMLSTMEGAEKRDFVGALNFLRASCTTYNLIHNKLTSNLKSIANRKNEFYINIPNLLKESTQFDSILEHTQALTVEDQIKLSILLLNEMSDSDIVLLYNKLNEQGEDNLTSESAPEESKPKSNHKTSVGTRDRQDNGRGGLKEIVGKGKDEYLEPSDSRAIASAIINEKDQRQKQLWLGYVSLLGAICPLARAMSEAYRKKKSAAAKKQINQQTINTLNANR